jgi:NadR type nicotinamide-nucleotide adenylyltransferase
MDKLQKIVVLGPESTGKSTLCAALAAHYQTSWVKEYARQYLSENGTDYAYENLLTIAKGQIENEEKAIASLHSSNLNKGGENKTNKLIVDTDMYVMKVWCEYVFNNCHPYILEAINARNYDLYLLCDIDLTWAADEMREYPNEKPRIELFTIYKELLINQNTPWGIVRGTGTARTNHAIEIIEQYLKF